MTQEENDLVLRDLCARLPYGVICQMEDDLIINDSPFYDCILSERHIGLFRNHKDFYIKPYLRPMSSMTEEEKGLYLTLRAHAAPFTCVEWLDKNHFDHRTDMDGEHLIQLHLALEAKEDMYKRLKRERYMKNIY